MPRLPRTSSSPGHRRTAFRIGALIGAVVLLTGCVGADDDATDDSTGSTAVPASVSVPPTRLTPFCQTMIDLSIRLDTDPPDDPEALIIETYLGIVDEVPEQIKPDFLAVLASLQGTELPAEPLPDVTELGGEPADGTTPPPTVGDDTSPDASGAPVGVDGQALPDVEGGSGPIGDEGREPSETPEQRLSGYVQFACKDAANNPGPPATVPLDEPDDTSEG